MNNLVVAGLFASFIGSGAIADVYSQSFEDPSWIGGQYTDASGLTGGHWLTNNAGEAWVNGPGFNAWVDGDGLADGDIISMGAGTDTIQMKNNAAFTGVADLDAMSGVEKFVTTDADGAATTDADPVSLTFSTISEGTIQTIIVDGSGITDSLDNFTVNVGAGTATSTFTITQDTTMT